MENTQMVQHPRPGPRSGSCVVGNNSSFRLMCHWKRLMFRDLKESMNDRLANTTKQIDELKTDINSRFTETNRRFDKGAFPISRSRAHTHRRHGHPLQTVPSAGLIERPQEQNRVDALR